MPLIKSTSMITPNVFRVLHLAQSLFDTGPFILSPTFRRGNFSYVSLIDSNF